MRQTLSIVLAFGMLAGPSMAETMAPVSVVGDATFKQEGQNWTITTTTDKTVINWSSFGVAEGARVHFQQPGVGSSVLNRALGSSASYINGLLSSNGGVYLFNPNGIVIGSTGVIRVADFVGTTLRLTDSDFLAGKDINLRGDSLASIENLGKIEAIDGDIYLIAVNVVNKGALTASSGSVNLVGATDVLLTEDHKLFIRPSSLVGDGIGVDNSGVIDAVVARLETHGNMYALAINNTGIVRATGYSLAGGRVVMRAEGGSVVNTGSVIARTTGADGKTAGGEIQVLGDTVAVTGSATLDASGDAGGGRILIGGDLHGGNPAVYNAQTTLIDSDAAVAADALVAGDGGTIIVWADGDTTVRGSISVLGAGGGDGGFVETSGHTLDIDALDLSIGQGGMWLLDAPVVITPAARDTIVASLNGDASITYDSPTDIVLPAGLDITAAPNGSTFFRLLAGDNIAINANIDIGDGILIVHAGDGATQAPDTTLVAEKLWVNGSGEFNLNQPGNDFGTVAVTVSENTSKVLIQDVNDLTIGRALGRAGVIVRGGEVHITTPNGHILANGLLPPGTVTGYHALGNVRLTEQSHDGSGIYEILISNNAPYNRTAAEIEAFLGAPAGSLDALLAPGETNMTGSAVRVDFDNVAGDSLGYDWAFRTAETFNKSSANDYAFVTVAPIPGAPEGVVDVQETLDLHKSDTPHDEFAWWIDEHGADRELNHTDEYALSLGAMNVDHDGIESRLDVREIRFTGHPLPPITLFIYERIFDYVEDFPHVRPDLRVGNVGARPLAPTLDEVSTYFDQSSQYTDPRYFYQSVGSIYQIPR